MTNSSAIATDSVISTEEHVLTPDDIDSNTNLLDLCDTSNPDRIKINDLVVIELLSRVAENGTHLKGECEKAGIKYNTVFKRMSRTPQLTQLDIRARQASLDLKVRTLNDLVDKEPDAQKARIKCDNIKWESARIYRKIYGDQITVTTDKVPLADKTDEEIEAMVRKRLNMKVVSNQ